MIDAMSGRILDGNYRVETIIGEGNIAQVFRATRLADGEHVAVKVARQGFGWCLEREATIARTLGHDAMVEIIGRGRTDEGWAYSVMERLEGGWLDEQLARDRVIELPLAMNVIQQLADVVWSCHDAGIVHGFIWPTRIHLCRRTTRDTPSIKLLGLGKAARMPGARITLPPIDEGEDCVRVVTRSGLLRLAPEQIGKPLSRDPRTDVYALGAVLYEMLSGRKPIGDPRGEFVERLMLRVVQDTPVPLSVLNLRIPARLSRVVARALSKMPEDRQPSVAVLWKELLEGLCPEEVGPAEETRRMAACRGPSI